MINQFSRTELIMGSAAMNTLAKSRVGVVGLGAAGASCAEALVRSGVGSIALFSFEKVSRDMLGGNIFADETNIGKFLADVAEERLLSINSEIEIIKNPPSQVEGRFDFSGCDYIVCAAFNQTFSVSVASFAQACGLPFIGVFDFGDLDCADVKYKIADINKIPQAKPLAFRLRKAGIKKLRSVYPAADENSISAAEFEGINACALGLIAAGEVIKDITGVRN